jgi:hypothetical protein
MISRSAVAAHPDDFRDSPGAIRGWLRNAARRDAVWAVVLAVSFVLALITSWQRWADPVVDIGREMNQPLRLLNGEQLYSDIRHIYGPLSPYLHAALYRLFGPSLTILYVDGMVCAVLVLTMVYWLARQVMGPAASGAATLHVMSLCVFKPAGNYILPYSYNSLHGATLGLIAVATLVAAVKRINGPPLSHVSAAAYFVIAGSVTGLAMLAKTEMGLAAIVAGVAAAVVAGYPDFRRGFRFAAAFCAPVALLTVAVYSVIAARVGWTALVSDSWLLFYNIPPELTYFNKQISGLANPARSIERMLIATIKVVTLGAIIAVISSVAARPKPRFRSQPPTGDAAGFRPAPGMLSTPRRLIGVALGLLIVMAITIALDRDKGPYLAMPFLLIGFLGLLTSSIRREGRQVATSTRVLLVFTMFALASLARMILHVRSGGAYASYVLPMSIVIFTYLWVGPFAGLLHGPRAAAIARTIAVALIAFSAVVNSIVLAYRYQTRNTVPIATARGTLVAEPDMGQGFNEALRYIARFTDPDDRVAVMPEGTAIDFLGERRNPLREEIITPGYLDAGGEERAIRQLRDAGTALILIPNRPTREFGPAVFGRDYCRRLMQWIDANYATCAIFGPVKDPQLRIGDPPFFIRAYCPRGEAANGLPGS